MASPKSFSRPKEPAIRPSGAIRRNKRISPAALAGWLGRGKEKVGALPTKSPEGRGRNRLILSSLTTTDRASRPPPMMTWMRAWDESATTRLPSLSKSIASGMRNSPGPWPLRPIVARYLPSGPNFWMRVLAESRT